MEASLNSKQKLSVVIQSRLFGRFYICTKTKEIIKKHEPHINTDDIDQVRYSKILAYLVLNYKNFVDKYCYHGKLIVEFIPNHLKNYYHINNYDGIDDIILDEKQYEIDQLKSTSKSLMESLNLLAFSDMSSNNVKEILKSLFIEDDDLKTLELGVFAGRLNGAVEMCFEAKTSFEDAASKLTDGGVEETKSDD